MIADLPSGRVLGARRPLPRYDLARRDGERLMKAVEAIGQVLFAAGAEEVLTGIAVAPRARSMEQLRELLRGLTAKQLHLSAFHPTGTVALGADPQIAPADAEGRLRGVRGVLIADASALPSCPEVNPQLTVMAVAHRVAETAA
jgi:choline dehydrogenase-like flavoprotein